MVGASCKRLRRWAPKGELPPGCRVIIRGSPSAVGLSAYPIRTVAERGLSIVEAPRPTNASPVMMNMEDLYRLLRASHVEAQGIVDTVSDPMLVLDENLCVQSASRSFFETFKVDRYETIGQNLRELGNGQWDIPELHRLLSEVIPRSAAIVNYRVEHVFPQLGRRVMLITARMLHHPDKPTHSILLSIVDATDQSRQDAAKDMLFGELRHRMKNQLSMVRSIARLTSTEGRSAKEYRDDFLGRFAALVSAQELAFTEQKEIGLEALIKRILAPFTDSTDAVVVEPGAAIDLGPTKIISLGLVLHELAMNAAKYGALSVSDGRLRVSWQIDGADLLKLKWVESDGPRVVPPSTTGYGTKLITSVATYNLGGRAELEYAVGGLKAEITFPLGSAHVSD